MAPTRRVALGSRNLPVGSDSGATLGGVAGQIGVGGILLAGIVANCGPHVQPALREELVEVFELLSQGKKVVQPAVRHRYQTDRVGLTLSRQQLVSSDGVLGFEFTVENARPVQLTLGALYAAGSMSAQVRGPLFEILSSALVWSEPIDDHFIANILGGQLDAGLEDVRSWNDPVVWALEILELENATVAPPSRRAVNRKFRSLLRDAHPDHGGMSDQAADRISILTEARDILLK